MFSYGEPIQDETYDFDRKLTIDYKRFEHEYESELQYRIQLLKFFNQSIDDNVETTFLEMFEKRLPTYIENIYTFMSNLEDNESKLYFNNIMNTLKEIGYFLNTEDNVMYFMILFSYDYFEVSAKCIQHTYSQHKICKNEYHDIMNILQA